ncbi:MAG TPA: dihydroorotate dehydrogenase [Lentisphaeria bacterium]|nr:MAG: dihydroorotate dehydrogenase B catalytic subunit [Lentisphaerae bacterium GWF2_50_93]HCE44949.1 dihydroorotate dehydrogenase [Lentisphaeria bacterium]
MADLKTDLGKIKLKNPVMTASGTFGYGGEYTEYFDISRLGAVVVKGVSSFPWEGNLTPRVAETSSGMLNAIGLQNPGVDKFLHNPEYMPFLKKSGATVVVNIWGRSIEEYCEVAAKLESEKDGIAALEINISCPNIKAGGIAFGTDITLLSRVISEIRNETTLPLITKLSPNVSNIADFAKAAEDSGSDMISLINTLPGMAIDIETRRPKIANVKGGLSGPAIKPVAVRMVYDASKAVSIPVIGMGGISNASDAIEFFLAGAKAIAVGTAIFADPMAPMKVLEGIDAYLERHGCKSISDIVGKMEAIK